MTDGNVNIQPTKKWYQKLWGKVLATIAIFGTLGVILEFIIIGVNWYNSQQETFDKVNNLEKTILDIVNSDKDKDNKILDLEEYVSNKDKSYAVGFRVFKHRDDDTGKLMKTKKYRDWSGKWNDVFYDKTMSINFGVDYYYYIDRQTSEKIYCW
jgi:hypothetical protein